MDGFRKDVTYAWRMLWKDRGLTLVALLTLALGIGANTSIFSVVNTILLKPLPYRDPERLVLLMERIPKLIPDPIPLPAPDVLEFRRQNHTFEDVAGFRTERHDLSGITAGRRVIVGRLTANLIPLLGVSPQIGRAFTAEEDKPDPRVALLSYGLWQATFGGDPGIVGHTFTLDRKNVTVVGVMPKSFQFPQRGMPYSDAAELWVPMGFTPSELAAKGDNFDYGAVARLKPGVTLARAGADALSIASRILETFPAEVRKDLTLEAVVLPLGERVVKNVRTLLVLLLGAVGLVLLIACTNIANLLLARSAGRKREMALRAALGASHWRLVRQTLAECVMLSLAGGGMGLAAAAWGTRVLVSVIPQNIPRAEEISLDGSVLLFTFGVSLFTGILFGLAPALSSARAGMNESLKEGGRSGTAGRGRGRLSAALIMAETALSLVLLVGAGLLIRSFVNLRNVDAGFQPERLLAMTIALPEAQYAKAEQREAFFRTLLDRVQRIPGVESASLSVNAPLRGNWGRVFTPENHEELSAKNPPVSNHNVVSLDYFRTAGIALKRGRYFTADDRKGTEEVTIINETLARRHFPGQDPVGQRLKFGPPQSTDDPWVKIVGVVADTRLESPDAAPRPQTYQSLGQLPPIGDSMEVLLRSEGDPAGLAVAAQRGVHELDPEQAIGDMTTMRTMMTRAVAPRQFNMALLVVFGLTSLVLASIGIFGVMAQTVAQRTHEIGIRMALGAGRGQVLSLVLGRGMAVVMAGIAIGIVASVALTRLMQSLLFGVAPTDALTFAAVPLVLALVAMFAAWLPARRATAVDPIIALRYE
jgi:putative ABC transport system permease protein